MNTTYRLYCFFCFSVALLAGCSQNSNAPTAEKAVKLYNNALEKISSSHYSEAEHPLADAIQIYSEINDTRRLSESYSQLALVQLQQGKLTAALKSFESLRTISKSAAERADEIHAMIEIGKIQFQRGMLDEATRILEEARLGSELYTLPQYFARASFELGVLYAQSNHYQKAIDAFSHASSTFISQDDLTDAVVSNAGTIDVLLRTGNTAAVTQFFSQSENILINNSSTIPVSSAYTTIGFSFLNNREWRSAKICFDKANTWNHWDARKTSDRYGSYLGIGEVYFNNYSYTEAQQYFINAYTIAKEQQDIEAQAYLLVRIADCDVKKLPLEPSNESSIRIIQFYEQAQNLFFRAHRPFGVAIVLQRLGMVKQLLRDENSAITHYRKAFDIFAVSFEEEWHPTGSVDISRLIQYQGTSTVLSPYPFASDLIALLLEQKKYGDAVSYIDQSRSFELRQKIYSSELSFKNPLKDSLFAQWMDIVKNKIAAGLELQRIKKSNDPEYFTSLQKKYDALRNRVRSSGAEMYATFPELQMVSPSLFSTAQIPAYNTVVLYYLTPGISWVITVRPENAVQAIRLRSGGLKITSMMQQYISFLDQGKSSSLAARQLSNELYSLLIAPIENTGQQRFIFITPNGVQKFPFHALEKNGRSLLEMIEVSYLPSLRFVIPKKPLPAIITNVAAFGFSSDSRWGLEFELRDIRSFFRNAQIYVNQSATVKKLEEVTGESIQISSRFRTTEDGEPVVMLADEASAISGTYVPITCFTESHPFPVVQMYDVQSQQNNITELHSLLWLINGSPSVITNEFPVTPKGTKKFGDVFYSSYSQDFHPYNAYRKAVISMAQKELTEMTPASYFYYGL